MRIRRLTDTDWPAWGRMAEALFPAHAPDELDADTRAFHARPDEAIFVAERPDGSVCGYVEVGARSHADGCQTSPVGYIEAWYVDPGMRRCGYGRALLRAAEEWARERGYQEIASDTWLDNVESQRAHECSGYIEVGRVVQYRKPLT